MSSRILSNSGSFTLVVVIALYCAGCTADKAPAPGELPGPCLPDVSDPSCPAIAPNQPIQFPPSLETQWAISGNLNTFSSPRAADLNGDCIADIIIGHGEENGSDGGFGEGYVTAHDGSTGNELWRAGPHFDGSISLYELVGTPTLVDLNTDNTPDVVIGGREAALVALNGTNGEKLWQFYPNGGAREAGWYNFYTTQPIEDINNDNVPDILTANGGDALIAPFEERKPGYLMLLSGADGTIISTAETPDGRETYMSPIVYTPETGGTTYVLLGTGGETFEGALWRTTLTELQNGNIANAQQLTSARSHKGVIAPPSLADVNVDGIVDIITVTFDGQVVALDGMTGDEIWQFEPSGYGDDEVESYATPAIGYFNGDGVPDVFVSLSTGTWPQYDGSLQIAVSGWDGDVLFESKVGSPGYPSPLAVDLNGDGFDEILVVLPQFFSSTSAVTIYDLFNNATYDYEWPWVGAGTPLIEDLDHDGVLDLVACYASTMGPDAEWTLFRKNLNSPAQGVPSWGGYLGTSTTGHFRSECPENLYVQPTQDQTL